MSWVLKWRVPSREKLARVMSAIARMPIAKGHPLELILRPLRRDKTAEQRGYFHVLCTEFGKAVGYRMQEMKQIVKEEFYGVEWATLPSGKKYKVVPSSEDSDREDYSALIDFTLQFAAEQGVVLPDPRPK